MDRDEIDAQERMGAKSASVMPKPRRVLDLESMARLHRDFAARKADRRRAQRGRQGRRL